MATSTDLSIHDAKPVVRMSGEHLWISIPLTESTEPKVTVLLTPERAKEFAQELIRQADRVMQVLELTAK